MIVAAGVLLIIAAVAFVALPFFGIASPSEAGDGRDERRRALEAQKLEAYAAIKDAELDYRMGKLTDADFQIVREQYAGQAMAALAALDTGPPGEEPWHAASDRRVAFCSQCGGRAAPGARYCAGCGRQLPARSV